MHPRKAAVRHALTFGLLFMVAVSIVLTAIYSTIASAIDPETSQLFRVVMIWSVVLLAALASATAYAFSQRITQRVQAAAATCESIMSGDRSRRLPVSSRHDELDSLAATVNRMLDQITELTRTRRTVFDSAAHDLRGPLYRLRNRIESMMRKAPHGTVLPAGLDEALRDIDGIQRTLVMLLQIARAESGSPMVDVVKFDLAMLVRDLVELFELPAREESLQLIHQASVSVGMRGNRQLVAQLISNLIENAIKYVPAGGTIIVSATRTEDGARLVVADNGPGIPEQDRARAVEPFVRLESAEGASGSGLGLSLVAAIARLHGAQFSLEDNEPGLRVIVTFTTETAPTAGQLPFS